MAQTAEEALVVRLEATLSKFENQMKRAKQVADKTSTDIEARFGKTNQKIASSATGAAGAIGKVVNVSSAGRFVLQNTANNIADIAVQMGSGTSAAKALGQQLPQILGGFGALGGVLGTLGPVLGTIAAVGLPIAAGLLASGEASQSLADSMKELEKAVSELDAATSNSLIGSGELVEKYGSATAAAREFLAALRQIAELRAESGVQQTAGQISSQFGGFDRVEKFIDEYSIGSEFEGTTYAIRDALGVTEEAAASLAQRLEELGAASGPTEVASAAAALNRELFAATGGYDNMNVAALQLYENTARVGENAQQVAEDVDRGTTSMLEFVRATYAGQSGLSGLIAQTQSLASWAATAAQNMWSFLGAQGAQAAKVGAGRGGDPRQFVSDQYWKDKYFPSPAAISPPKPKKGGGGGGGGKAEEPFFGNVEEDLLKMERQLELIGKSSEEVATLKAKWEMLDEARKRGLSLDTQLAGSSQTLAQQIDAQAAAVGALTAQYEAQQVSAEAFEEAVDGIAGAMADALAGGQSLREGLADVFAGIAADLAKSGIRSLLSGLFNGIGGGSIGSWVSGLVSADGGGYTGNSPRAGGLDGKGGFLAMLHPRETVVDHTKGQKTGGGAQTVHVYVSASEYFDARVDSRAANITKQGLAQAQRQQPDSLRKYSSDSRRRS